MEALSYGAPWAARLSGRPGGVALEVGLTSRASPGVAWRKVGPEVFGPDEPQHTADKGNPQRCAPETRCGRQVIDAPHQEFEIARHRCEVGTSLAPASRKAGSYASGSGWRSSGRRAVCQKVVAQPLPALDRPICPRDGSCKAQEPSGRTTDPRSWGVTPRESAFCARSDRGGEDGRLWSGLRRPRR
jgi:hypothetical protein